MANTRILSVVTLFALLASTMFGVQPAAAIEAAELAPSADEIWDVTTADTSVRHTGRIRALVWDLEEHEGRMFVVGKFLNVKAPDGTLHDQPYVAAFDLETGEWDPTFRPVIDGAVYAMDISDDGRIFVAGELTGGVAAYDIATGERDTSFDPDLMNSWGPPAVFDVELVGNDAYIGGSFTEAQGTDLRNLAKIDTTTGALDLAWLPTADLDTGTPRLAGSLVWAISPDPARDRIYVVGKFGGINGDDTASYFATLDPDDGSLRTDVPQGIPRSILNHRESFSMWMQDVQWHDDKVYIGGQGHQTITLDADTLTPEHSFFTNRGVGDTYAGGDTQVIFVGEDTVWSGCHCWGSVGRYPLGEYIADPDGLQTYDEYRQWVLDFRDIDQFGQQRVNAGYGLDIESNELVPLTFNLRGQAGGYAIFEDSLGRLWMGGQYQSDSGTGRVIEGLARFSPRDAVVAPLGLRSTLQTAERVVLTWDRLVGAESYEILVDGEVVGSSSGVWFTAKGLDAATDYEFSVRAVMGDGSVTPASALVVATRPEGG